MPSGNAVHFLPPLVQTMLRLGSVAWLAAMHGWSIAVQAYGGIWQGKQWALADFLQAQGLGNSRVFASALGITIILTSLGLFFGFLSRTCAAILALLCLAGIFLLPELAWRELLGLYFLIFLALLIGGPGAATLDNALRRRRRISLTN